MDLLAQLIDVFLHLDRHLAEVIAHYGVWTYALLFLIVFCETGLVVTPILPGDSLLFAAGTFAGIGSLDLRVLLVLLIAAAVAGDAVNYSIGRYMGPRVFTHQGGRFLRREYLDRTHAFYEKYGGKTIILARFVPIVRTFAPFVAGVGSMTYWRFASYNVIGAVAWVSLCLLAGQAFGNVTVVREHFSLAILGIVFVSILPGIFEYLRHRRDAAQRARA